MEQIVQAQARKINSLQQENSQLKKELADLKSALLSRRRQEMLVSPDEGSLESLKQWLCDIFGIRRSDFDRRKGKQRGKQEMISLAHAGYIYIRLIEGSGKVSLPQLAKEMGYKSHVSCLRKRDEVLPRMPKAFKNALDEKLKERIDSI